MPSIAIVGAGLIGRVMALKLAHAGKTVTIFDKDNADGFNSCAYVAGGLLTPYTELDSAEPVIYELAKESITGWQQIRELLPEKAGHVFLQSNGCIVVAHAPDMSDLRHLHEKINSQLPVDEKNKAVQLINSQALQQLEPELRFQTALYFPDEGQIDNRQIIAALGKALQAHPNVTWHTNTHVESVEPHQIVLDNQNTQTFEHVIDCRGLGAKQDLNLRGVRGEIIRVHVPEVTLNRPVRLMHPRYVIYIIPRENHHFVIGATSLESEDKRQVTVQSALELLSAAFSVHKGFAEAEIIDMTRNWRPALPNHLPQIISEPGLMTINGLYRWGFMLTPALSRIAMTILEDTFEANETLADIVTSSKKASKEAMACV